MTWLSEEQGVQSSRPVELYRFTLPTAVYLYTSHVVDVNYGDETYTAIGMERSTAEISPVDPMEVTIEMPIATALVQDIILGGKPPPERVDCTILRYQPNGGAAVQVAEGPVMGWPIRGRTAGLRVSNRMAEAIQTEIGGRRISTQCNHVLYDSRCSVSRTQFDWATTIVAIDGRTLELTDVGALPDDLHEDPWFVSGELTTVEGERRRVVAVSGVFVTIDAEYRTAEVGMGVTLYAGCDHSVQTCLDKFDNVINFGGHPGVPKSNPWLFGLRGDAEQG